MSKMPELASRLRRLIAMNRAEIAERFRQGLMARSDLVRFRLGHDFTKAAQAGQSDEAPGRFFFAVDELPEICGLIKREIPEQSEEIVRRANRICDHRFDLLGYENLNYDADIDWHCDAVHQKHAPKIPWFKLRYLDYQQVGDAKITWELNRHQHFVTLAKAWLFTGDQRFAAEVLAHWEHWWKQNPYPIGINWASALEVALRVQSWIWTFWLLQGCPLFTDQVRAQWIAGLKLSGRHIENNLSTYFSPNTHLLGEALALFFLGTLFRSPSVEQWRKKGWEILIREAGKQVREDGFYFEQSTYYHVYAVDMLLHARILAGLNGVSVPGDFDQTLEQMLDALFFLSRAGVPHMFGDDDGGRLFDGCRNRAVHMLDPLAAGAVLYRRGDFKSLVGALLEESIWLLGLKRTAEFGVLECTDPTSRPVAMSSSCCYLMFDAAAKQQLFINAGRLGAGNGGHGHADTLSVSLIRDGRVLLRDSGSFEYVGPGPERSNFRGTGAHSTLRVDSRNQAEITGPFSWRNLPSVHVERWINGKHFDLFEGSHGGYSGTHSPIIHRRQIFHAEEGLWVFRDAVEGDGEHEIEVAWHVGPGLAPVPRSESRFSNGAQSLSILTDESCGWLRTVSEVGWSPVYGKIESAYVVRFSARRRLPVEIATLIVATSDLAGRDAEGEYDARLMKTGDLANNETSVYRCVKGGKESCIVFARGNEPWVLAGWASDAELLYASNDPSEEARGLVLCGGKFLDAGGRRILSCTRRVSYAEVWEQPARSETFSSDQQTLNVEQSLAALWAETEAVSFKRER